MSRKPTSSHKKATKVDSTGLDEASKLVEQITKLVGAVPALSAKDRKRSLKLRKGGETVIPTVAALSEQYGLSIASHPTTTMVQSAMKAHPDSALQAAGPGDETGLRSDVLRKLGELERGDCALHDAQAPREGERRSGNSARSRQPVLRAAEPRRHRGGEGEEGRR